MVVVALAASPWIYKQVFHHVEEEIRLRVQAKLKERFPELHVEVRSARLVSEGILAYGVSLSEAEASGPQPELAYFEEALLACQTSLKELVSGDPAITGMRLTRPVVRATRRPDGRFSCSKLVPNPRCRFPLPGATVVDGTIEVFDPLKNPSSTLTLRNINLSIKSRDLDAACGVEFDIEGSLNSELMHRMDITGTLAPDNGGWSLRGTVDGLEVSPELRESLPQPLAEPLEPLAGLRARANLGFKFESQPAGNPKFEITGQLLHGSFTGSALPGTLTELTGRFECNNAELRIYDLTARDGAAVWQVQEFRQAGFGANSPFVLRLTGNQVYLNSQWGQKLREPWATDWKNYDPEGHFNLVCKVHYDGQRYHPDCEVTALDDVSFCCRKFPYRLERSRGKLMLRNDVLDVDATAFSGAQPVKLVGKFWHPGPQFTGWIEIRGDNLAIDERLFAALAVKPKAHETLRSLKPRDGTFNLYARLSRDDPRVREMRQSMHVTVNNGTINYDKFRYELKNVQGTIRCEDGVWTFEKLVGMNSSGVVTAWGTLVTSPQADVFQLILDAKNVPLEPELRDALHPGQRALWDSLAPQGKIDLRAQVDYDSHNRKTTVDWRAFPRNEATSVGTIIEPVAFPYHLKLQSGSIHYRDGEVELKELRAVHRDTSIRAAGSCRIDAGGGWHLRLHKLEADPLRLQGEDRELAAALPEALRRAINEMKPGGLINLRGALDLAKTRPDAPLYAGWDVELFLHQSSLQVGPKLENIFGSVQFTGSAQGGRYASRGELKIDSLTYKNFQATQVQGPLWLDNSQVVLGAWPGAQLPQAGRNRRVTANVLGGRLGADCRVRLGDIPHYHLLADIDGADMAQFARENLTNHQKLNGKVVANVDLQGAGGGRNLFGNGKLHLSDANVYELPVMMSLLKIARAKTPDATAFTQSDIAFDIRDRHIILNQIHLNGDAINLSGNGELTLDGQTNPINLQLHTRVLHAEVPLISGLAREVSQQVMLLHVEGPLENPVTRAQAFPAAQEALQQLQADSQQPPLLPGNGSLMRAIGLRR